MTTQGYYIVACVADSYDFKNHVTNIIGGTMRQMIIDSGRLWVVRPDSGIPSEMCAWAVQELDRIFGSTVNSKGFKVLNHVRIIQGDGISHPNVVEEILMGFMHFGFSAENIAFGMGGGLLQKCDRDTLKYAMKCSALTIDGQWVDVYKDPVTDHGKRSKKGRVTTAWQDGKLVATTEEVLAVEAGMEPALVLVFKDGEVVKTYTWEEVRQNAHGKAW
jgi:nicotinamide phosphoribosyltransferase